MDTALLRADLSAPALPPAARRRVTADDLWRMSCSQLEDRLSWILYDAEFGLDHSQEADEEYRLIDEWLRNYFYSPDED